MGIKTGKVKWFNKRKGYGFIIGDDGAEYFVHYSDIVMDGYRSLQNDARVEFHAMETSRGLEAMDVKVLAPNDAAGSGD